MRLFCLEHVAHETPANILKWADERGLPLERIKLYEGAALPSPESVQGLIVMGGTMSVADEASHSWLKAEKTFLKAVHARGTKMLGLCLGAQLLAEMLGAKVKPAAHKEIGWFTLELTEQARQSPLFEGLEPSFLGFEWHGETFELPPGAIPVARGTIVTQQGFVAGDNVLALQFHPEVTWEEAAAWIKHGEAEMKEAATNPYIQRPYQLLASPERFVQAETLLARLLDRFFGVTPPAKPAPASAKAGKKKAK